MEEDGSALRSHGKAPKRTWRHLNIFEHNCYIECALPRAKCLKCGKVHTIKAPWEGMCKGFTRSFETFALMLIREMPVNSAAKMLGEHDTRLWRMLNSYVIEAYSELDFSSLEVLGCDELSYKKGQNYLTVFADIEKKQVIYATPGKDKGTWDDLKEELPQHNASFKTVKAVSMDMSRSYQSAAKTHCPDADIVFDKFHVIKNLNEAIEETRKREMRHLDRETRKQLKKSRWLYSKNPQNYTEYESAKFEKLKELNLHVSKAYQMKLTLQDIYKINNETVFRKKLLAWTRWVSLYARRSDWIFAPMKRFATSILKHFDGILSYCKWKVTNAYMEGFNSVFSAVKRKARGFRSIRNLITMIYYVGAKLDMPRFA